ncbi:MAG: heavy metal translocating P-type ATPase [Firmicutes bacterium]|nr:heavy metal translocating P-type ATPase [Bacillota bacterium]
MATPESVREVELNIQGMTCASCVLHVEKALASVPGVDHCEVSLALERARVRLSEDGPNAAQLVDAVKRAGYRVATEEQALVVAGLEEEPIRQKALSQVSGVPGVVRAVVNASQNILKVERVPTLASNDRLLAALARAGLEARVVENREDDARVREMQRAERQLMGAVVFTVPLWVAMTDMVFHWGPPWVQNGWIQALLATAVEFGPGFSFIRRAWQNLIHGNANMDVLVATGTLAAWVYSLIHLVTSGPLYFDTSATVVTLILVGKYLEALAKGRTSETLRQLLSLRPSTAYVVTADGSRVEQPVESIGVGDRVWIRPGDRVPVDGRIESGRALVDESMLTGEPALVSRGPGEMVSAGTIHRGDQAFQMVAERVGRETVLAQIVAAVEEAQMAKAPIQQFADRVANVFVPTVILIALVTAVASGILLHHWGAALLRGVAVLVVACPCSLGLATPTAVMVGTGRAAKRGILFRNGEALQRAAQVTRVALDKTGTLTEGRPRVVEVRTLGTFTADEVLAIAASVESESSHPLAKAIRDAARDLAVPAASDVYGEPGAGVVGCVNGADVLVGNQRLLRSYGIELPEQEPGRDTLGEGATLVWCAIGSRVEAVIAIADPVRPDAVQAVRRLKNLGLRVAMLTGDRPEAAASVAARVGIDEVHAALTPAEKANRVAAWEEAGERVAMVGDGINDAPALARAFVGVAVAQGTDVAQESAEVTLMRADVEALVEAFEIGRKTLGKIRQNLLWALFYNVLMIPLAAFGVLSPMLAGGMMAFSSVFVVSNSLLLNRGTGSGDRGRAHRVVRERNAL